MQESFIVLASVETFQRWVAAITAHELGASQDFPAEGGSLRLYPAFYMDEFRDEHAHWTPAAVYMEGLGPEDVQRREALPEYGVSLPHARRHYAVISFELIVEGAERTRVHATCTHKAVLGYYVHLREAMPRTWASNEVPPVPEGRTGTGEPITLYTTAEAFVAWLRRLCISHDPARPSVIEAAAAATLTQPSKIYEVAEGGPLAGTWGATVRILGWPADEPRPAEFHHPDLRPAWIDPMTMLLIGIQPLPSEQIRLTPHLAAPLHMTLWAIIVGQLPADWRAPTLPPEPAAPTLTQASPRADGPLLATVHKAMKELIASGQDPTKDRVLPALEALDIKTIGMLDDRLKAAGTSWTAEKRHVKGGGIIGGF